MIENTIDKILMLLPTFDINLNDSTVQVSSKGVYTPHLFRYGSKWRFYWAVGDYFYLPIIEGNTPTEAIQKAYDYCVEQGWIKEKI